MINYHIKSFSIYNTFVRSRALITLHKKQRGLINQIILVVRNKGLKLAGIVDVCDPSRLIHVVDPQVPN